MANRFRLPVTGYHSSATFFRPSEKRRIREGGIDLCRHIRAEEDAILNRIYYERLSTGEYPREKAVEDRPSRRARVVRPILNWHCRETDVPEAHLSGRDED